MKKIIMDTFNLEADMVCLKEEQEKLPIEEKELLAEIRKRENC